MISTANADIKTCGNCGEEKPLGEFRLRKREGDSRDGRCRACYNAYMRSYRRRRRSKRLDKFAGELARERSLSRSAALASAMATRFGGVQGLAETWADQLQVAAAERPGSATVLRGLGGVVKLFELSEKHCRNRAPSQFSDEDLEAEFRRLIAGK